jgi:hypothetical protein
VDSLKLDSNTEKTTTADVPLPAIVVWLRIVGILTPIAGFVVAGTTNMGDGPGFAVLLVSVIGSLLWFALASVVRLLDRIEKHLAHDRSSPR